MTNREVPYKSQWDDDAKGTRNDCGPASIAMLLNYYGENVKTDDVFARTGAGQGLITINQIQKAIASYGYTSTYEKNQTPARIKELIDKDTPPMLLVHYGSLNSVQDKTYKGGHFFDCVGYYDGGYYVNDPNFWGNMRADGDHHNYTKSELEKAWNDAIIDENSPCALLWIARKQPTVSQDEKRAMELIQEFKVKEQHGNLEGAVRALLGDHEKVLTLETELITLKSKQNAVQSAVDAFLKAIGLKKKE
jgi:ABC-type bacteriocin/lantibiotic exporter with double-glycine peptidase domain